jgi:hypothetical protein
VSEHDQKPAAESGATVPKRIASLVAQLWAIEMHRQLSVAPDPLFLLAPIEDPLLKAAERGEGLDHAAVLKLLAATGDHRRMCRARLKRHNREGGLWRELLDLLLKRGQ